MDIEVLRTFRDVVMFSGITEAARHSHLSQQAVSKRIASLEKELGCQLLVRTNPVAPTPAGRAMLRYTDEILSSYDQLAEVVHEISGKPTANVKLRRYGTNTFARIASGVSKAIAQECRNIMLDWVTTDQDDYELLASHAIDVGFRHVIVRNGIELAQIREGFNRIPLPSVEFPLFFAVREGHPLLRLESPSLDDILSFEVAIPAFASNGALTQALRDLERTTSQGIRLAVVYCTTPIGYYPSVSPSAVALCSGGAATGISPEGMGLGFRLVRPHDADYTVVSYAVFRSGEKDPTVSYILDTMRRIGAEGPNEHES